MKKIFAALRYLARNPKTSGIGVASLVTIGFAVAHNPRLLGDALTVTAIFAALAQLFAADAGGDGKKDRDE